MACRRAKRADATAARAGRKTGSTDPKTRLQMMEKRVDMLQEAMQQIIDERSPSCSAADRADPAPVK